MENIPEFAKNLGAFLAWIAGPNAGGYLIIAWALSWAAEKFGFWKNMTSDIKGLIVLGTSILLGFGAYTLNQFPAVVEAISPYFMIVVYCTIAWLATQIAHAKDPLRK